MGSRDQKRRSLRVCCSDTKSRRLQNPFWERKHALGNYRKYVSWFLAHKMDSWSHWAWFPQSLERSTTVLSELRERLVLEIVCEG